MAETDPDLVDESDSERATESDAGATDTSVVVAVVRDLRDFADWLESSTAARAYRQASTTLATATANSALARFVTILITWVRHSFVYRWLTKEPDPEVVVIDLRETYTVGPVIALLNRVVPTLERWWTASTLDSALDRTADAVRWAPIRVLGIIATAAIAANLALTIATKSPSPTGLLARTALLTIALAGTRVQTSWDTLAQARTVQLLVAALEPPEPPERASEEPLGEKGE